MKPKFYTLRGIGYALVAVGLTVTAVELLYPAASMEYVEHHPHEAVTEDGRMLVGADRGSCWEKTRTAYIKDHPACEVCGSRESINIHHVESFHEHPERECDPTNLIATCRPCHLAIGHRCDDAKYNWSCTNPRVREEASLISGWLKKRGKWPVTP